MGTTARSGEALLDVEVGERPWEAFTALLDAPGLERIYRGVEEARPLFSGRTIWNVNSTARGGGVAEMLAPILAYARGIGVDARWVVVQGDAPFFVITKRLHNRLHGAIGDGGPLGPEEHAVYASTLAPAASELAARMRSGDLVILHDPQTAGLIPALKARGIPVVWRCHIGADRSDELVRDAHRFLLDDVRLADRCVFSRPSYAWEDLPGERLAFVMPSIDPFSPKNAQIEPATVAAILAVTGVTDGPRPDAPVIAGRDGDGVEVHRPVTAERDGPLPADARYVLQVSRWDVLKDHIGVMEAFARHLAAAEPDVHLVLAGPAVDAVTDDPEGAAELERARLHRLRLPEDVRARVHLLGLPMDDVAENALIVNALQRGAAVVVQKSLAEGFGLTVTEAMWKARPVVASAIGGIADQIEHDRTGMLVDDPRDLATFAERVLCLLRDPTRAASLSAAAREHVRQHFLSDRSLIDYLRVLGPLALEHPLEAPAGSS